MAWQDRPYYRDRGDTTGNPLMWLWSGSVHLFTVFGIRVRAHAALLLLMVLVLLVGLTGPDNSIQARAQSMAVLFGVILLHEFGHCFAARWTGGSADEIIMTPLGGLAMAMARRQPWPTFVTVAGGPLVNVIICLVCGLGLYFIVGIWPLGPWTLGEVYLESTSWLDLASYLFWIYSVSYFLLIFNLLPVFPMDGGQLLQSILWKPMGYYKSMILTLNIGLVGSVLIAMVGIATFGKFGGGFLLILIAVMCFLNCYRTRAMMKAEGPWGFTDEDSADYSASLYMKPHKTKPKRSARLAVARARREARRQQTEQAAIDAILAKVSAHGMHSLTWWEKRTLKKATERQRRNEELLRER